MNIIIIDIDIVTIATIMNIIIIIVTTIIIGVLAIISLVIIIADWFLGFFLQQRLPSLYTDKRRAITHSGAFALEPRREHGRAQCKFQHEAVSTA